MLSLLSGGADIVAFPHRFQGLFYTLLSGVLRPTSDRPCWGFRPCFALTFPRIPGCQRSLLFLGYPSSAADCSQPIATFNCVFVFHENCFKKHPGQRLRGS
ncbi:MAG: hypothetical protein ACI97A_001105 [Planctomycetota bacterium]|jgi:hypothetical protein